MAQNDAATFQYDILKYSTCRNQQDSMCGAPEKDLARLNDVGGSAGTGLSGAAVCRAAALECALFVGHRAAILPRRQRHGAVLRRRHPQHGAVPARDAGEVARRVRGLRARGQGGYLPLNR